MGTVSESARSTPRLIGWQIERVAYRANGSNDVSPLPLHCAPDMSNVDINRTWFDLCFGRPGSRNKIIAGVDNVGRPHQAQHQPKLES